MSDPKREAYDACLRAGIRPPKSLRDLFEKPRSSPVLEITGEELMARFGTEWPPPDPEIDGTAFTEVLDLNASSEDETYTCLAPHYPDRRVPTEWGYDVDDERVAIAWRDMTEEEWQEALAVYTKARKEWERTGGQVRVHVRPPTIRATFRTEVGGEAKGIWLYPRGKKDRGRWVWTEWCSAPAQETGPGAMWPRFIINRNGAVVVEAPRRGKKR